MTPIMTKDGLPLVKNGKMFAHAACCCCTLCETGELPETVTVTFSGLAEGEQGPWLAILSGEDVGCYGSGFEGRVTMPGGATPVDNGPISAVELIAGGSGYAKLARISPTLSVAVPAVFALVLTADVDACVLDFWRVSSVTVTAGGSGYVDGSFLAVIVDPGSTEEVAAVLVIRTVRTAPTVTAASLPGTGADLTESLASLGGSPETWQVTTIAVVGGGTGYIDGNPVQFTYAAGDTEAISPQATVRTVRAAPTVTAAVDPGSGGSGAVLGVTLTSAGSPTTWSVTALSITTPGTLYAVNDIINFAVTVGQADLAAAAHVTAINGSGGITGVLIDGAGQYWLDTGVIGAVTVNTGGVLYHASDEPFSVTVLDGGRYYEEDAAGTPYVAALTVLITQQPPSDGWDAEITATIDNNTASGTFGQVISLAITTAGQNYLAWENACGNGRCGQRFNGVPIVLRLGRSEYSSPEINLPCEYIHSVCGVDPTGHKDYYHVVYATYRGPDLPPLVGIRSYNNANDDRCDMGVIGPDLISDCGAYAYTGTTGPYSAEVAIGGTYDPLAMNGDGALESCDRCCGGAVAMPAEITVRITIFGSTADVVLGRQGTTLAIWEGSYMLNNKATSVWLSIGEASNFVSPHECDEDYCPTQCRVVAQLTQVSPTAVFGPFTSACFNKPACRPAVGLAFTGGPVDSLFEVVA